MSQGSGAAASTLASYTWMADGAKYASARADGSGYVYKDALVFERNAAGKLSLDAALTTGGRITAQKDASTGAVTGYTVHHHITDHLGSVRAVVDFAGNVLETSDFLPYGTRWSQTGGSSSATITDATNRWRYSGKEEQSAALNPALSLIDYGARMYDPTIARWMSVDPLAEKYYPMGGYNYCAGSPISIIDRHGEAVTDYYNLRGKRLQSINDGKTDKFFVLETTSQGKMLLAVPSNTILEKMDQSYKMTEDTGLEHGFRTGEKGGTSIIVSGGPDEITDEQWKPAIDDLRENVGENVAYDVHTHPIDIKGSTNQPSDTDKAHMVGNDPSYVLGYEARNHVEQVPNPVLGGQKASVTHTKSVSVYDKSGNVSKPFDYSVFKRTSQKINNEKD